MGTVFKVIGIVVVVVLIVALAATAIGVGKNTIHYMSNQGFEFGTALEWGWNDYTEWLNDINPMKGEGTDEVKVYPMTNQNIVYWTNANLKTW